jgi:DNA recombination protein RmuC
MTIALFIMATIILCLNLFLVFKMLGEKGSIDTLREHVYRRFDDLHGQIGHKLQESDKSSQQTFSKVMERLVRIDEAQKKIEALGGDVASLQNILTDKKTRGLFGEVQLSHILTSVFGEKQGELYSLQQSLSNQKIVDAVLYLPEPLGTLAVDSKFPLENYRRMVDETLDQHGRDLATKEFVKNVKKHIDDIKSKYIIAGVTSDQAMMFIPAEAIFAQIHAYHSELVEYSIKHQVWMTSPTTLMATLTTIQMVLKNIERSKHMDAVHQEINKLGLEFERYEKRWDDLSKHVKTVTKDVDDVQVTSNKIAKRFQSIMNLEKVNE